MAETKLPKIILSVIFCFFGRNILTITLTTKITKKINIAIQFSLMNQL